MTRSVGQVRQIWERGAHSTLPPTSSDQAISPQEAPTPTLTPAFDRGHREQQIDASLDQIGWPGQAHLGARHVSAIKERGLKVAKCGPGFFKKLSQVEGAMRVKCAEFGRPEVFRGQDMNYFRFRITMVNSNKLSVHNSWPDLRHFRPANLRQTDQTHPSHHLW